MLWQEKGSCLKHDLRFKKMRELENKIMLWFFYQYILKYRQYIKWEATYLLAYILCLLVGSVLLFSVLLSLLIGQ